MARCGEQERKPIETVGVKAGSCIEKSMRVLYARFALLVFIVASGVGLMAGPVGSFRGTIVDMPRSSAGKNWLYVQGRNGSARRVEISRAKVIYDEDVPATNRASNPSDALVPGAEVRVTAEQASDGEWRAERIEILQTAVSHQHSAFSTQHSALSNQDSAVGGTWVSPAVYGWEIANLGNRVP